MNSMFLTDGYKLDHRRQYPEGTEFVYSNLTARSAKHFSLPDGKVLDGHVVFGIRYLCEKYLIKEFNENFFSMDEDVAALTYRKMLSYYLGKEASKNIGDAHIRSLHRLGYLPVEIRALPEGTICPIGVPCMTIINTKPEFYWVTNFLETLISSVLWMPMTSSTTAREFKKELKRHCEKTGIDMNDFLVHDFSMRGMPGVEGAVLSGMGHLAVFSGSESIPAIVEIEKYYNKGLDVQTAGTIAACYAEGTEILTNEGWKKFKDLTKEELVAQYEKDGSISFVKPIEYFKDRYKGKMIWFKQKSKRRQKIDILVTPNHKMIRSSLKNKLEAFEAKEVLNGDSGYTDNRLLIVSGKTKSKEIDRMSAIERLHIAFQADGSFPSHYEDYDGSRKEGYPIRFSIKKDRKYNRIIQLCKEANVEFTSTKYDNGYYSIWARVPYEFKKDFEWVDIDKVSENWCNEFIDELKHWDGMHKDETILYSSTNKKCIDVVQAICVISGKLCNVSSYKDKRKDYNRKDIYTICITQKEKRGISNIHIEEVDYEGYVYCVSVPSKMIVVRNNDKSIICGNTEHSVACANTTYGEDGSVSDEEYLDHILEVYPSGFVSTVADTYDFWRFITKYVADRKDKIMDRDGRLVIRPDSGIPEDIIAGDPNAKPGTVEYKGAYEILWEIFGGTVNKNGYKVLDSHIGMIYGDSITMERQAEIYRRLEAKGFSASNLVLGVGSWTYQGHATRDSLGFAVKATWARINGKPKELFKDPKTVVGMPKKSLRGFIQVHEEDGKIVAHDRQESYTGGLLEPVFINGRTIGHITLKEIRERINSSL